MALGTTDDRLRDVEASVARLTVELTRLAERVPPERTALPEPVVRERRDRLEARIGSTWLGRLGIVSLISGVAFLIVYRFGELGPILRVAIGYLVGGGLVGAGFWLSRRHVVFGRIVMSGGLATTYFLTYALHFVPALRLIDSEPVALVLLAAIIAGIVAIAHRLQSETVAGVALFLGLHTGLLSGVTTFTLLSTCLLAGGAVFFLVANRWVLVPLSTLVAVYSTHVSWMVQQGKNPDRVDLSLAFLALYFALFSAALLVRPAGQKAFVRHGLPVLNALGLTVLGTIEVAPSGTDAVFTFVGAVAIAHAVLALGHAMRPAGRPLVAIYLGLTVVLAAVAAPLRLEGAAVALAWAVLAVASAVSVKAFAAPILGALAPALLTAALIWMFAHGGGAAAFGLLFAGALASERIQAAAGAAVGVLANGARALHVAAAATALMAFFGELVPARYAALGWTASAVALFVAGFALRAGAFRLAAFGVLGATLVRLFAVEFPRLGPDERILSFLVLGVALLGISFVYTRRRARHEEG